MNASACAHYAAEHYITFYHGENLHHNLGDEIVRLAKLRLSG